MAGVFDYVNSINFTKEDLFEERDNAEEEYVPYLVNKSLSYFPECLLYANEMNIHHNLPKKVQFDYLRRSISKSKRYSKWAKKDEDDKLDTIKEYYGCNSRTARDYAKLIDNDDILRMEKVMNKGNPVNETIRSGAKKSR